MKFLKSKITLIFSGILTVVFQLKILSILRSIATSEEVYNQQTTFSREEFKSFFDHLGPEKTEIFLSHYHFDFFYPIFYGIFLASLLARMAPRFFWLPLLAGLFDELENICQLSLIKNWVGLDSLLFEIGAASACLKWLLAFCVFIHVLKFIISKIQKTWQNS